VTEPHVGYSKDQIAQALLDTELDTTPANAVVIDAVARFCPQSDQRGQDGEMHDVFIVVSEGSDGQHVARTVYAASEERRAPNPPGQLRQRAHRGGSPMKPSRLVTFGGVRHRSCPLPWHEALGN
jgi:hypothetical protein